PGQFEDAEEEREALQTLSEKLISNERDLSNYGGERNFKDTRARTNLRSTALKKKQHKHMDNLKQIQAKEFIVEDINWTNFINYDRYLSVPASIQNVSKKDNVTNQIELMRILIGQNPSYTLSDKKVFYETLARSLKPLMETKTNP
ncbi:13402_t:CDS:2, partial [Racocetra persica]